MYDEYANVTSSKVFTKNNHVVFKHITLTLKLDKIIITYFNNWVFNFEGNIFSGKMIKFVFNNTSILLFKTLLGDTGPPGPLGSTGDKGQQGESGKEGPQV